MKRTKQKPCIKDTVSTFVLFSSFFSSSKTMYSIVSNPLSRIDSPLSTLIRWFPARATEVEVLACRRCLINLSLTRHLRDCVRAICYAREVAEDSKSRASGILMNINELLQNTFFSFKEFSLIIFN